VFAEQSSQYIMTIDINNMLLFTFIWLLTICRSDVQQDEEQKDNTFLKL